jgi:hypothetical protein
MRGRVPQRVHVSLRGAEAASLAHAARLSWSSPNDYAKRAIIKAVAEALRRAADDEPAPPKPPQMAGRSK